MRRAVSRILPSRNKSASSLFTQAAPSGSSSSETTPDLNSSLFKIDLNSVADFYITVDEPHKLWLPGDEVSGQIILISKKNLANISITLSLVGKVKINASSHSKLRPVKHTLFNHTIKIYGGESDPAEPNANFSNGLYKGEHRFPFIVKLPNKRVYTSIDFGKGSIVYLLRASIGTINSNNNSNNNVSAGPGATPTTTNESNNSNQNSNVSTPPSGDSPNNESSSLAPASKFLNRAKLLKVLNNSTFTSEKLINLINPIDVAKLPPAKAKRLVLKDPRYANKKLSRTASSTSTINTFTTLSSNNSDTMDSESRVCNTSNNNTNNSMPPVTPLTDVSSTPNSNANSNGSVLLAPSKKPDTIKVSLEIPHRGYLRGELIPIKLNINHLRKIQDLSGIIITFVRVCRIDNGPETLFDSFRKDLQQLVIPLFVDPNTFQSEINTSVRVPADSFPTISGCPLVSFQYFIEVLINLSGKSLSIDQESKTGSNGNDLIIGAATSAAASSPFNFNYQPHGSFDSKERSTYINTDKYKRMKKFLQLTTEVIIGTHRLKQSDSTGAYNNNNQNQNTIITEGSGESSSPISRRSSLVSGSNIPAVFHVDSPRDEIHDVNLAQPLNQPGLPLGIPSPHPPQFADDGMVPSYDNSPSTSEALIPLPQLPDLSEKEQMRLREVSLLPSAPPLDDIEEDLDGVSPINGDEDILQQINERVHENINVNDHEFDENDQQEYDTLNGDADDSNDQYSEIDFVPNYESVHNDRLVTFERENRNNSSPNVTNEA